LYKGNVEVRSRSEFLGDVEVLLVAGGIVDYADGEGAAGAFRDVSALSDIGEAYLEFVAAGARVVKYTGICVEIQVFYFNFVVNLSRH
jgi:hypothetical protein